MNVPDPLPKEIREWLLETMARIDRFDYIIKHIEALRADFDDA